MELPFQNGRLNRITIYRIQVCLTRAFDRAFIRPAGMFLSKVRAQTVRHKKYQEKIRNNFERKSIVLSFQNG